MRYYFIMSKRGYYRLLYLLLIVALVGSAYLIRLRESPSSVLPTPTTAPSVLSATDSASQIGTRTKASGCTVNGLLPDKDCTPGAVFDEVTRDEVCTPGYSAKVRDVPESEKKAIYQEYGIYSHTAGQYEVDHYISLELGGSNDIANLWPEAAAPRPGFHEKDKVENYLHDEVCRGAISLQEAQREIATDWFSVYETMKNDPTKVLP